MGRMGLRAILLLASGLGIALLWSRPQSVPVVTPVAAPAQPVAALSAAPSALPGARKREPVKVVVPRNDEAGADPAAIEKRDAEEREIQALRSAG